MTVRNLANLKRTPDLAERIAWARERVRIAAKLAEQNPDDRIYKLALASRVAELADLERCVQ